MIRPPFFGTFSMPLNSILNNTRLSTPTTGLIVSSAHCGNGERSGDARGSSRLIGCVPLLPMFRPFILQRPFLIYELHMNSRNTVDAGTSRSNSCVCRDAVLFAGQSNKSSLWNLKRRENCSSFGADVFSNCVFTHDDFTVKVYQFHSHINRDLVTCVSALIRNRRQNIVGRCQRLERRSRDVVTLPRFFFKTCWRTFSDERDPDVKYSDLIGDNCFHVPHDGPNPVLILD